MYSEGQLKSDAPHTRVAVWQGVWQAYDAVLVGFDGNTLVASEMEKDVQPELLAADLCLAAAEIPGLHARHRVKFVALAQLLNQVYETRVGTKNGDSLDET